VLQQNLEVGGHSTQRRSDLMGKSSGELPHQRQAFSSVKLFLGPINLQIQLLQFPVSSTQLASGRFYLLFQVIIESLDIPEHIIEIASQVAKLARKILFSSGADFS